MDTIKTDVIIIGAGPTGLSLACQFVRYGIDFVVVEKSDTVTRFSKAIGVQARTLEIYDQMELAQPAIERGTIAKRVRLIEGGEVRGEMHLANFGRDLSEFPYVLILEQSRNEELLYQFLRSHGRDVLWKTELESFAQTDAGVTAQVKTASGESQTISAKYLVGCDGASSSVRHGLGLTFEGSTFERLFYVADARVDWALPHDALHVCLARDVFTAFFPMPGEHRYRIIGTFPESKNEEEGEVVYEEIERQIKDEAKLSLEISDVKWFSLYKVHSRRVNKFSEGRCFLAGDSAHIHSPAGAQGMNTGIQDAYNLAWKLALVIKGHAAETLLETYNEERLANAKRLLESTDRFFEFAAGSHWLMSFIRTTIFPPLAGYMANLETVSKRVFPLISQIGVNYRNASLSQHTDDEPEHVKAGDRLPYFLVNGQSVFKTLKQPKFHFLLFSNGDHENICEEFGHVADCHVVPIDARVREIFEKENDFVVFLRPDNHIAFISSEISLTAVREYLDQIAAKLRRANHGRPRSAAPTIDMPKRLACSGLILLLLTVGACSSRNDTAPVAGLTSHYVESVNTVSGSFSVDGVFSYDKKPFNINPTQAYARIVKNPQDQNKNDVLIVLVEKPLSRFALAVAENNDTEAATEELKDVLQSRDARGVVFRVAMDRSANSEVRPYFNGNDYDFGHLVLEIKSLSNDKVDGQIKSNVSSQQANINFSVRLQPDVWTGGTFYEQPPTKLSPGQASGQLVVNDKAVKLNHAYARLVELDLFDATKNVYKVWLTEKPVDEKVLFDDSANNLLAMKNSGNNYVFTYNTTGPVDRSQANLWWVSQLSQDTNDASLQASSDVFDEIPGVERDYVRYGKDAIEGRLFSAFPIHQEDRIYKVDLLFNAAMLPPTASNGPVTANNGGTALPAGGGAPAKAYFAAIERMRAAKGFDEKMAVWLSVVPAADAQKIKRDLESVSPAQRQMFLEVFAPLDDLQLVGGFIKDNKATLRFTGTGREGKATEVVNMHLEDGQWKIGRREIREE